MNKDNEIYVTSNGELYKKGVEQAIYPQTNYTTQQFYTKEEYDRLQAENDNLKDDIDKQQLYVDSLEQENEKLKQVANDSIIEQEKLIAKVNELQAENERLKSALAIWENATLKQTALKVVEVDKYRQALQEIRDMAERQLLITNVRTYQMVYYADFSQYRNEILDKINEVIGAE